MIEQLAVRISGKGKKLGSGVLYHSSKSECCYVYTCAHVLEGSGEWLLEMEIRGHECRVEADAVEAVCIETQQDIAVLRFLCPEELRDTEDEKEDPVFVLGSAAVGEALVGFGYPQCMNYAELAFDRDVLKAKVKAVSRDKTKLQLRLDAADLNQADRDSELTGFSGTGLFREDAETGERILCGLLQKGRNSAARNIAYALSSYTLLRVLRQYQVELPEDIEAGLAEEPVELMPFTALPKRSGTELDREACEEYIDLKVKAADGLKGNEALAYWDEIFQNAAFAKAPIEKQYRVWDKYLQLLYMEDHREKFWEVTENFQKFYPDAEPSFYLSRKADMYWRQEEYAEADICAQRALLQEPEESRYVVQSVLTEAFAQEQKEWKEIKSRLVYPDGTLNLTAKSVEILEYADQVLEVIAIRRFHLAEEGLFFAKRAYERRKREDLKEDLANSYYLAAVEEMTMPDGKLNIHKKNAEYLNQSREYYRCVFDKAEGTERKALLQRQGSNYFRCLSLLNDVSAMRHIYKEVCEACPDDKEIVKMMSHAVTQWGSYDEEEVQELPETTKKLLQAQTALSSAEHKYRDGFYEEAYILYHQAGAIFEELEKQTDETDISHKDIYVQLMNVYYFLTVYYGENNQEKFEQCYQKFAACDVTEAEKQNMQFFRQELQGDLEGAAKGFAELADREDTLEAYNQLLHFYTRHGDREAQRRLYEYMVSRKGYLIEEDEEYFYRNYIDFYLYQCMDPLHAMEGFLKYGNKIKDIQARQYLEMQLRNFSGDFGDMERFLELNEKLYKEQWYGKVRYQGMKALYHLHNGQYEQALEDYEGFWNSKEGIVPLAQNLILRLNHKIPPVGGASVFNPYTVQDVLQNMQYIPKNRNKRTEKIRKELQAGRIVADAWALYILAYRGQLEELQHFSEVYVTYNTHTWLMQELLTDEDARIRQILYALQHWDNIHLRCPAMEAQVHFRKNLRGGWIEEHANICMANELHIPLIIGRYMQNIDMGDCWRYLIGIEELQDWLSGDKG